MIEPTLRYYACGETEFPLSHVFRGHSRQRRVFPSGVFLFRHSSGARVLFDTGYAPSMAGTGVGGAAYSRILPARVASDATIDRRLNADGLSPESIDYVVLSHLHPDHIGGIRYFPHATFVLTEGLLATLTRHRMKDGVIPRLIPRWFGEANKRILDDASLATERPGGVHGEDLFGDGEYILTPLPGHARGHLGALVRSRFLLAGDAAWGRDLVPATSSMRWLPRTISHDVAAYQSTVRQLLAWEAAGISLCFSHDTYPEKVLID